MGLLNRCHGAVASSDFAALARPSYTDEQCLDLLDFFGLKVNLSSSHAFCSSARKRFCPAEWTLLCALSEP
jgi:hypothetical protein